MIRRIMQAARTDDKANLAVSVFVMVGEPADMPGVVKKLDSAGIAIEFVDCDTLRGECIVDQKKFIEMLDSGWTFTDVEGDELPATVDPVNPEVPVTFDSSTAAEEKTG